MGRNSTGIGPQEKSMREMAVHVGFLPVSHLSLIRKREKHTFEIQLPLWFLQGTRVTLWESMVLWVN